MHKTVSRGSVRIAQNLKRIGLSVSADSLERLNREGIATSHDLKHAVLNLELAAKDRACCLLVYWHDSTLEAAHAICYKLSKTPVLRFGPKL